MYQFCAIHTADNTDGKVTGGGKFFVAGNFFALHRHLTTRPIGNSSHSITTSTHNSTCNVPMQDTLFQILVNYQIVILPPCICHVLTRLQALVYSSLHQRPLITVKHVNNKRVLSKYLANFRYPVLNYPKRSTNIEKLGGSGFDKKVVADMTEVVAESVSKCRRVDRCCRRVGCRRLDLSPSWMSF